MNPRRFLNNTLRFTAIIAAALLVCGAALFLAAQTDSGRQGMARLVIGMLSDGGKEKVEIGKGRGIFPFRFEVDSLSVRDEQGVWLDLRGLLLDWSPVKLLKGLVHVRELWIASFHLERLPGTGQKKGASPIPLLVRWFERLKVERLAVGEAVLGAPLLGERAVLRAEMNLMAALSQGEWLTSLQVERSEGPYARLTVSAKLKEAGRVVTLDVEAVEASGGLFSRKLASGTEAVSLSLRGHGPAEDWRGRLEFRIGEGNLLRAEVTAGIEDEWRLGMEGALEVNPQFLPGPLASWIGMETRFAGTGRLVNRQTVFVDRLSVETGNLTLGLSGGSLNLRDSGLAGHFTLLCRDLKPLGAILNTRTGGTLKAEGDLRGTLDAPGAVIAFVSQDLEVAPVRIPEFRGETLLDILGEGAENGPGLRLRGKGEAKDFSLRALGAFPEKALSWELDGDVPFSGVIRVRSVEVGGERVSVRVSGDVDPSGDSTSLSLDAQAGELGPVTRWVAAEFPGAGRLTARVKGNLSDASLEAGLKGTLSFEEREHAPAAILGREMAYEGRLSLKQGRELAFPELRLNAAAGTLAGSGSVDLQRLLWNGAFQMRIPDLQDLPPVAGTGLSGTCLVEARLEGTRDAARLSAAIQGEEILFGTGRLGKVILTLDAAGVPLHNTGSFRVALGERFEGTTANARFALIENRLSLSEILISGPGRTRAGGELWMDLGTSLGEGVLKGRCEDLSGVSALLGETLGGSAEFTAEMSAREGAQQVTISLNGAHLSSAYGKAESLDLQARLRDVMNAARGSAAVRIRGFRRDRAFLSSLDLETQGDPGEISFKAKAAGSFYRDFDAELAGLFGRSQGVPSLTLREFRGHYGALPLRLGGPARILWGADAVSWDEADLGMGDGHVSGSGRLGQRGLEIILHMKDVPLELFMSEGEPRVAGRATGELRMTGVPEQPDAEARLSLVGVGIVRPELQDLPPGRLEARGELKRGTLSAELSLGGFTTDPISSSVEIPLDLSLSPPHARLRSREKIKGNLTGTIDLARLGGFMGLVDQALGGSMQLGLALEGTAGDPGLSGGIDIRSGTYENARTGTILKDVHARIAATPARLLLESLQATDGESGDVAGRGWLALNPGEDFPFEAALSFQKTKLLRQDWASATAGGKVEMKGTLARSRIYGNIQIESGEIRIPERFRPDTTGLEVVEINGPPAAAEARPARKGNGTAAVELDLTLKSQGRVLLSGRGLESEWGGDLRITGSPQEPVLTGALSVVRGRFNFLGKRFTLKEGEVTFDGTTPPAPFIEALAEASTMDMTARLRMQGPLRSPQIRLSSDPALPSDEVLSRLLFGRSASRVSPMQALQLVQALNMMAGGSTLDLLGQTRRFLGVDQLEVKQTAEKGKKEEETSIAAGKYLHDNVYLEVEKGLGPKGDKASLEWEITPHISVETEVGTDAERGIGLNWKWDY
ncbi:MAG: translocation/assembly module TamB domain-containing protein [Thermodesulfobacteriota bacterium]